MNPYDQAHALARSLKESEEYREYTRLKEVAYEDATNKALLDEYKKLQFRMQAKMASGENMPEDDLRRLQQIGTLLQFNPEDPYEIRDRGLIYAQLDCEHVALNDLNYFVEQCPEDPISEMIRAQINAIAHKHITLH